MRRKLSHIKEAVLFRDLRRYEVSQRGKEVSGGGGCRGGERGISAERERLKTIVWLNDFRRTSVKVVERVDLLSSGFSGDDSSLN